MMVIFVLQTCPQHLTGMQTKQTKYNEVEMSFKPNDTKPAFLFFFFSHFLFFSFFFILIQHFTLQQH